MIQDIFFFIMLAIIFTGGYCAYRLDDGYPMWLRLLVLAPFFAALIASYFSIAHKFIPDHVSLVLALSLLGTYVVIADALSHNDNRWFRKWHNTGRTA